MKRCLKIEFCIGIHYKSANMKLFDNWIIVCFNLFINDNKIKGKSMSGHSKWGKY